MKAVNRLGASSCQWSRKKGSHAEMLRVSVQQDASGAKSYYRQGEYYAEGLELAGEWGGLAATKLGLLGEVTKSEFAAMCENRHPKDGTPLTVRTKVKRRVLFDLNFHVPKSVSIVHGLLGDDTIRDATQTAVGETMREIEADIRTRVRKGGRDETRTTGNIVYARFVHTTTRPVDGIPDPHLHAHCCVFNATFDNTERTWKAIELGEVYAALPFYEAAFHSRLAKRVRELGYDVYCTRTGWEIAGVPERVLKAFSRRTEQIETRARELGITDDAIKDGLGAKTRQRKQHHLSLTELRREWFQRLTPDDERALRLLANREIPIADNPPNAARESMRWAIEHAFERESVVPLRKLLSVALRHGVGVVCVPDLMSELSRHDLIIRERDGQQLVTTKNVLNEESRMLDFARNGRGRCLPLVRSEIQLPDNLSAEQQTAIQYLLKSPDRVMLLRGVAGTGKTTLMKTAIAAIEASGQRVVTLAPSAFASRGVLRGEGFETADTVAKFLTEEHKQEAARGQVLWIDEAGLLGTRLLTKLFAIADKTDARVILCGDVRQHAPVDRGLPLRLLETEAGLVSAEIKTIRRQRGHYRHAVQLLSEGKPVEGFDVLANLGWIREVGEDERTELLAREYLANMSAGKSTLVVAPTHTEGQQVTNAIRSQLKANGKLSVDEYVLFRLDAKTLTVAERQVSLHFDTLDVLEFHRRAPGFKLGVRYTVTNVTRDAVAVTDTEGVTRVVPLKLAERFTVYRPLKVSLAIGDRVRITKNGKSADGQTRLDNGRLDTIAGFTTEGDIQLVSGVILNRDFAHLAHGYAVTSYASQGRTVDRVLLAASAVSTPAVNREQFYVSVSRGREQVTVFTDDVVALRRAIQRSDPKMSATELNQNMSASQTSWRAWVARRFESIRRMTRDARNAIQQLVVGHASNRDVVDRGRG